MRTHLTALLALALLLAPMPALAAPERGATETRASLFDAVLERLGELLTNLFGASDDDNGHGFDPNGLVAPTPPPGEAGAEAVPSAPRS